MPLKIFQFECNEAHVKKHISGGRFGDNFFMQNSALHSSFGHWVCGMGGGNEICVWSLLLSISINNIWVFIFRFLLWCLSIWVFLFGASFLGLCFQGLFFYLKIGVYSSRLGGVSFWNPLSTGVWLYTLSLLERLKLELDISGEKP